MKKIYMAGAGGMLGEAFYYTFKNNYKITCSDKDVNEQWLNYLNFTNHDKYMSEVSKFSPDYLFHLGAITDLEYCEKNKEEAIQSNLEAVKYAVNISNQLNIKLLLLVLLEFLTVVKIFMMKMTVLILCAYMLILNTKLKNMLKKFK